MTFGTRSVQIGGVDALDVHVPRAVRPLVVAGNLADLFHCEPRRQLPLASKEIAHRRVAQWTTLGNVSEETQEFGCARYRRIIS